MADDQWGARENLIHRSRARRPTSATVAASAISAAIIVSLLAGYWAGKQGVLWRARDLASQFLAGISAPDATAKNNSPIERETRQTAFQRLEIARLPLGRAWSLEEAGGHLLFSTRYGKLGYMTGARAANLRLEVPLGLDSFNSSELAKHGSISLAHVRVTDMLTIQTAPNRYDLYVGHMKYADECFRLVVSKTRLMATPDAVTAAAEGAVAGPWSEIYKTRDCIAQRAIGSPFIGDQSGGRLVQLDSDTLAFSVGDFEFTGGSDDVRPPSDPGSDLGKIITIGLKDGHASVYASGLRNPQGLLMTRSGDLWETEHGPQGGDELNLIKPEVDYGWPHVTYGKSYDIPGQTLLPSDARVGSHDGYERPRYAFVPSIGVSNLIEADTREFPQWDRRLVVSSLKGNSLHVLRVEDNVVISDEPITIPNQRMRDLISLSDGRMAFATDDGDIFVISNAEKADDRPREPLLTGIKDLGPGPDAGWTSADLGQIYFTRACSQCHSLTGDLRGGPPLNALMGRRIGGDARFEYSDALSERQEAWTPARLKTFLKGVNDAYPGTDMPQPTAVDWIPFIVDYLATRDGSGANSTSVGRH